MRALRKFAVVVLIAAVLTTVGVFAAAGRSGGLGKYSQRGGTENCGICDNLRNSCQYADENGDGICDNREENCRYVDGDGDGLCDRCGQTCPAAEVGTSCSGRQQRGQGASYGRRRSAKG